MKYPIIILLVFYSTLIFAQHTFSGNIDGYIRRPISICEQFGDESKLIETINTDNNGSFMYVFINQPVGLYRMYLDSDISFDIIYNNEDIHLVTKIEDPQYNMMLVKSEENKQLYAYLVENYVFNYKIDILTQLSDIYPDNKFRNKVVSELNREIKLRNKHLDKVIKTNPDSFAGRYLQYFRVITAPSKFDDYEKNTYIKEKYFEIFAMNDTQLINSNAYNEIIINYFKLFKSNNPDTYYEAGKTILDEVFFEDPKVFNFIFEYILSGFESLSLDEAAAKLSLDFGDFCSDDDDSSLKMRIKSNTELSVGKKAPDFTISTVVGDEFTLSEMQNEYTLIVFWATWCAHCDVALPRLATAESIFREADMDILAVSLDSDTIALQDFLKRNALPWNVICEYQGWDGEIVKDYAIYATPTMMIVDKDLNIVAKPFNEDKLYDILEDIIINKRK